MNIDSIAYKPNATAVAERLALLWSRKAQDRIFAQMFVPVSTFSGYSEINAEDPIALPDISERFAFWDGRLAELATLEDDSLPSAYLMEFDQGISGGVLGAPMRYLVDRQTGWISSMTMPILDDLSKIDSLKIDMDAEVLMRLDEHLRFYSEKSRGKFGIAPFIVIDAMNFVVEARGATQAYLDPTDSPDLVRQLMDFAFDLNVFLQERVQNTTDTFLGGSFCLPGLWAPGNPVMFSVDAYHLASPGFYYEWGEPHLQKLLDHFGGGHLHIHSNGRHLIEHAAKLRNLTSINMGDDIGNPRAYDELELIKRKAGDVPLIVGCEYGEFVRDLESNALPGNVLYMVVGLPSIMEANLLMEKVRGYRV